MVSGSNPGLVSDFLRKTLAFQALLIRHLSKLLNRQVSQPRSFHVERFEALEGWWCQLGWAELRWLPGPPIILKKRSFFGRVRPKEISFGRFFRFLCVNKINNVLIRVDKTRFISIATQKVRAPIVEGFRSRGWKLDLRRLPSNSPRHLSEITKWHETKQNHTNMSWQPASCCQLGGAEHILCGPSSAKALLVVPAATNLSQSWAEPWLRPRGGIAEIADCLSDIK